MKACISSVAVTVSFLVIAPTPKPGYYEHALTFAGCCELLDYERGIAYRRVMLAILSGSLFQLVPP